MKSVVSQEIQEINNAIRAAGAKWNADETSLNKIPRSQRLKHLGFVPGPRDKSLKERERVAKTNLETFHASTTIAAGVPEVYDLRNLGGQNFITPIRDQGGCGSCVAFGTVATVEGMSRIQANPNPRVDLSEAHLFYCYGRNDGRTCENGWWPDAALDHFRNNGVVDEACYPYTDVNQNCLNLCSDWNTRLNKINSWKILTTVTDIKSWISTKGPVITCFTVYDDFFSYRNGIYSQVSTNLAGGHCVSVIGYNDTEQYWICKNSWGTGWGENGFFRIAYGQCGIDAEMWTVEIGSWLMCLYADLLNREPDQIGFGNWRKAINEGSNIAIVVDGFLRSQEYCSIVANSLYNHLLDRQADPSGLTFWVKQLQSGVSFQEATVGFCDSDEYKSRHPVPNQFVESLYNKLLGRQSDPGGLQYWVNQINSGRNTTAQVINPGFLRSREYTLQRINESYQKYLGRQPDSGGLDFWANKLQNGVSMQEVTKGFVTSAEYLGRSKSR